LNTDEWGIVFLFVINFVDKESFQALFLLVFSIVFFIVGLVMTPASYLDLKKIEIAPKVYIIDYLKGHIQ
jgi:hypothetical protein